MLSAKSAFVVASLVFLSSKATGQTALIADRAAGSGAIESYYCDVTDELGAIAIAAHQPRSLHDRAEIEWRVFSGRGTDPVYRAELPFHTGGAIQRLDERRFLVAGIRYFSLNPAMGVGVICRIRLVGEGTAIAIDEEMVIEADPTALLWDSDQRRLYLHDRQRGKLFAARWPGWPTADHTPSLPPSAAFVQVADFTTIPALSGRSGQMQPAELSRGGGVHFETESGLRYQISPLGPTWTVRQPGESLPGRWRVADEELQGIDEIVIVRSDRDTTRDFRVEDLFSGMTVATGVLPEGLRSVTIPVPQQIADRPGSPFRITGDALRPSNVLFPLLRMGRPIASPSGTLNELVLPPGTAMVGNTQDFAIGTQMWFYNGSMRVSLHLGFAVRDRVGDAVPVANLGGGATLLEAELELAIPFGAGDLGRFVNRVSQVVPIGADPDLAGSIAYWQWLAVFADGSIAGSDVVGHTIWPASGALPVPATSDAAKERVRTSQRRWRRHLQAEGFRTEGMFKQLTLGLSESR